MRYYGKRRASRTGSDGTFWLSYSDMMSSLVLVFMLVMFYSIYQYYDMMNLKEAEIAMQQAELDASKLELDENKLELDASKQELDASRAELESSREELSVQQAKVLLAQSQLESYEALLQSQKEELEEAQSLLSEQQAEYAAALVAFSTQQDELEAALSQLDTKENELEDQRALYFVQQAQLDTQQRQLDELVGVRAKIIEALAEELGKADIRASVDRHSGAITLEASVLFDTGKNELTEAGMRALDKFLPVYLSVLLSEENAPSLSEVIIEGHTDSDGTYMNNLELSQRRAYAVLSYILGDEYTSISSDMKMQLRGIVTANGRSESQLIYAADGTENKDASRRVEFKFRLQDEQMIESMRAILENFD